MTSPQQQLPSNDLLHYAMEAELDIHDITNTATTTTTITITETEKKYVAVDTIKRDKALQMLCKMFIGYPTYMREEYWEEQDLHFAWCATEECVIIENVNPDLLLLLIHSADLTADKIYNGLYFFVDYGIVEFAILDEEQNRGSTVQDDLCMDQWQFIYPDILQKYTKAVFTKQAKEVFYEKVKKQDTYVLLSRFLQHLYLEDFWKIDSKHVYLWNKNLLLWTQTPTSELHNHVFDVVAYAISVSRAELEADIQENGDTIVAIQTRVHTEERKLSFEEKMEIAQLKEKKKDLQYKHNLLSKYVGVRLDKLLQQVMAHCLFHFDTKEPFCPNSTMDTYIPIQFGRAVNLKTGMVRPRLRKDHFTCETNVKHYYGRQDFPLRPHLPFYKFLEPYLLKLDKECRDYFQLMFGYFLTGSNSAKAFFVWYGQYGNEGKSAFLRFFLRMMGKLARTLPKEAFVQKNTKKNKAIRMQTNSSAATPELMCLQDGVRFALVAETEGDDCLNDAFVKRNTGGDQQYARGLYAKATEFTFGGKFLVTSNYFPFPQEMSHAMQDRIKLVSTFMQITNDEKKANNETHYYSDPSVLQHMNTQQGIDSLFVYCLKGAMLHYQNESRIKQLPAKFKACLSDQLCKMSILVLFIQKVLLPVEDQENANPNHNNNNVTTLRDVFEAYLAFAQMHVDDGNRKIQCDTFAKFRGYLIKNGFEVQKLPAPYKTWVVKNVQLLDKHMWSTLQ